MMNGFILQENTSILISRNGKNIVQHFTQESGLDQNLTEVKFENSINRATAVANPRQIERAVKGLQFGVDIIYEVEAGKEGEIEEDIEVIAEAMRMLQYDYLGGSGSRGYGKVKFYNLKADNVIGDVDENIKKQINELLSEIQNGEYYEIYCL